MLLLALSTAALSTRSAVASPSEPLPPAAKSNPQVSLDVVESLPKSVQDDPTVYIDPSVQPDMPQVYADTLKPVPGQDPDAMAAAATCGSNVAAAGTGAWFGPFQSNCAFIGGSQNSKLTYTKFTDPNSYGRACWQGRGYDWLSPSNTYREYWAGMGCSDGSYTVDWGNVISVPAVKARSITAPVGFAGAFRH